MTQVTLSGKLTDIDIQGGTITLRTGKLSDGMAEHKNTGLGPSDMKVLGHFLFEPVEIIIRPVNGGTSNV